MKQNDVKTSVTALYYSFFSCDKQVVSVSHLHSLSSGSINGWNRDGQAITSKAVNFTLSLLLDPISDNRL